MSDIDKTLNVKPRIKPKTIVPEQYWDYLNVFDEDEANQLPPIRGKGINHGIELLEEEGGKKPTVPWGPLYNMSKDELLVLKKTLTEYLDKVSFGSVIHQLQPQFSSLKSPGEACVFVFITEALTVSRRRIDTLCR